MTRPIPLGHMDLPEFGRSSSPLGMLLTLLLLSGFPARGSASPQTRDEEEKVAKEEAAVEKAPPGIDLSRLVLRNLGPATMGGRVVDLAFHPQRRSTFYVATASGGLWRTVNAGTTFLPLFQHEECVSIGAVALAPSDPKQIWVGTGEANNRNSSSWGNGVYKSSDAGKTWKHMGLPRSFHIGRIAVHPRDPRIVFVAALGSLWGPGPERGLYRTKDGGESWTRVLKGDARTGCTEVRLDPENPDLVYAALYERQRDAFDGNHPKKRWGEGSGLYRSTDGGDSFEKLSEGLPTCRMGRISLDIYRKDPKVVYALIETEKIGTLPEGAPKPEPRAPADSAVMGARFEDAIGGVKVLEVQEESAARKAGLEAGDLIIELAEDATADSGALRS
ncbi:MAG: PDZ domain-containing protein, partial [Planctomycetota bacterium]